MGKREQAHADLRHALDALDDVEPLPWPDTRPRWCAVGEGLRKRLKKRYDAAPHANHDLPLLAFHMAWNQVIGVAALRRPMTVAARIAAVRKLAPVMLDILLGDDEPVT